MEGAPHISLFRPSFSRSEPENWRKILLRKAFCETLGTQLELPDVPERIVSFSPAVTETLFLLGAGEAVVGVSAFCHRPREAQQKKVLGSYNTVDKNLLNHLNPDLVFTTTGYQRAFAQELSKDFPVYAVELPVSVVGIVDTVVKVGLLSNKATQANTLVRILVEKVAEAKPVERKLKVYVEIDFNEPVTFGAYSYIIDALRLLSVKAIYGDQPSEWLSPDLDVVQRQNPDVIIYEAKMFKPFQEEDLAKLIIKRGWESTKAVRTGQVFLTPRPLDFLAHHGPSFVTSVLPWLKKNLDAATAS